MGYQNCARTLHFPLLAHIRIHFRRNILVQMKMTSAQQPFTLSASGHDRTLVNVITLLLDLFFLFLEQGILQLYKLLGALTF